MIVSESKANTIQIAFKECQKKETERIKLNRNKCTKNWHKKRKYGLISDNACQDWTMKYRSVVGYGKARLIEGHEGKIRALNILMEQYTTKGPFEIPGNNLDYTAIIKIEITGITGKQSV